MHKSSIAIYGGTFDPVHNGHLKTAIRIQTLCHFDRFLFLPCKVPVLKDKAQASTKQRIDMLELALAEQDKSLDFELNLSEINREGPSYMIETLKNFRNLSGNELSITLIIGQDSFNQLPLWHLWDELIKQANILIMDRSGIAADQNSTLLSDLLENHETSALENLKNQPYGQIYRFNAGDYNMSSTLIRNLIHAKQSPVDYLPRSVLNYIEKNQIYSLSR